MNRFGRWWRMALKITVKLGANEFTVDGDVPFSEIKPSLEAWLAMTDVSTQAAILSLTRDLKGENDRERKLVDDHATT